MRHKIHAYTFCRKSDVLFTIALAFLQYAHACNCSFAFLLLGIAYRNCLSNAQWDVAIDVSQCQTVELTLLDNRAQQLQEILNANTANDTRDLTVMFDIAEVQAVSEELTMLTDTSQGPILPMDVSTANDILTTLIRYTSRIKIHVY